MWCSKKVLQRPAEAIFKLIQTVNQATHDRGHILDWVLHISDDHLVQFTTVSHTIASDHTCLISHLNVTLPPSQPAYVLDCNSCTINRTALKENLVTSLSLTLHTLAPRT